MAKAQKKTRVGDQFVSGRGTMSSTRAKQLAWLLEHPDRLTGLPSDSQDVDDAGRAQLVALGEEMVAAGLWAKATKDRVWGLRVMIGEARKRLAS